MNANGNVLGPHVLPFSPAETLKRKEFLGLEVECNRLGIDDE